jgi:hypothetical protein
MLCGCLKLMNMRIIAAALLCLAALSAGGCTSEKPKPNPNPPPGSSGIIVKITPSKVEFAAGEAVVLKVELINGEAGECRVTKVTQGTLAVVSLTRDGNAVTPGISEGTYIDGTAAYLRQNLVPLAPGKSVSMELKSDQESAMDKRHVLETSAVDLLDAAALTYWPVSTPGKYILLARYTPPQLPDPPGALCRASGDPAQAEFTVKGV